MKNSFVKMQGIGNDFIVFDTRNALLDLTPEKIRWLCDRRLGIGADMVILIEPVQNGVEADVFMRIYNFDGSEVGACGNATRCVAGLLLSGNKNIQIQTLAGILVAEAAEDGEVAVDMGMARLEWQEIPLNNENKTENIDTGIASLPTAVGVNMGNPHAVFFVEDAEAVDLGQYGPRVENHELFPEKTNVEFVHVMAPGRLRMRVWERGVGITPACGSGACAAAVAAIRRRLVAGRRVEVQLDGGDLTIEWRDDNHVIMTGPWAEVYRGEIAL